MGNENPETDYKRGALTPLFGYKKPANKFIPDTDPITFTLAPSPGASFCLGNAVELVRAIVKRTDITFDEAWLNADLAQT